MQPRTTLVFMSVETGGAHQLAKKPNIQLDTELHLSPNNVRMDIMGDNIILLLVNMRREENPESDSIYLVDWKQGYMALVSHMLHTIGCTTHRQRRKVHHAPNGTYEGALAVLSSGLFLLLRRDTLSIELCRVTSPSRSSRGGSFSSDDCTSTLTHDATPSLCIIQTLALPLFRYSLTWAHMQTDRHFNCRRDPEMSLRDQDQESVQPMRAPAPLPFHSAPEDRVVIITFVMYTADDSIADWKRVVTTVSHRTLFALAAEELPSNGLQLGPDRTAGNGAGGGEGEGKGTVKRKREGMMVPWEEWGPRATRIIPLSLDQSIMAYAGQRWLSLNFDKLVIRDFSAARVRHARAHFRSFSTYTGEDNNEREEKDAVAAGAVIQGGSGSCFKEDVVSLLPFLETRVDVPQFGSREFFDEKLLTDGERLIIFQPGVSRTYAFLEINPFLKIQYWHALVLGPGGPCDI
jgi:hypothetical protein